MTEGLSRRHALAGAAAVGIGVPVLVACGGGEEPAQDAGQTSGAAAGGPTISCRCHGSQFSGIDGSVISGPSAAGLATAEVSVAGEEVEVDGEPVGPVSEVPAGGGKVYTEQEVVVTQPEAGEFKAFTAVCPHQGCLVSGVEPA